MAQQLQAKSAITAVFMSVLLLAVSPGPGRADAGSPGRGNLNPYVPIFTNAQTKLEATGDSGFTSELISDAVRYEPLLVTHDTQVHMGFWSGAGNHGSLARVLDDINFGKTPCSEGSTPNCAIWDEEATTSEQYPQYVIMMKEHWYDRGNASAGSPTVTLYGKEYPNINSLDYPTADQVWGQYSQRYADMALDFYNETGKPVMVWCFVIGAAPNRIFYAYEYPELQRLEAQGVVKVHCAKTMDADWTKPDDWTEGTGSAACPVPTAAATMTPPASGAMATVSGAMATINVYNRK